MKFVEDFKGMVKGDPKIVAELNSSLDGNGNGIGLTIPPDIQTAINTLKRQYDALEQYVTVVPVTTPSGKRNLEKWTDVTPLENIDNEDDPINDNNDPQLTFVTYLIQRYAGISTMTNTLLKDTAEAIIAWVTAWIAKKTTVTRNAKILSTLGTLPAGQKTTVAKIDDIKDILNVKLDPAIKSTTLFFTNQSGFNVLDKVKDAFGNYVLQPMVCCDSSTPMSATGTQMSSVPSLLGKRLIVISDKWLPNTVTGTAPDTVTTFPLFIGDMKEAVVLFDREQMSLATTTEGAGAFEKDQTKIRVIDRFDVVLWDNEAIVNATFTAIADQKPAAEA
jgi:HK97 family phage major capsid protein